MFSFAFQDFGDPVGYGDGSMMTARTTQSQY
jgi:hypothetical protein